MSHRMTKFADGFAWLLSPIRQYHTTVAKVSLICLILLGSLDYGYKVHGRDLLWWRTLIATFNPLYFLLYIVSVKVSLILAMAVLSCIRSVLAKKDREVMPTMCARRRYCRFIVMELLSALDEMLLEPETMDLEDYMQRHATFATEVQRFRFQARKLFERTDQHVHRPQNEVFYVDDLREAELLQRGYADKLGTLPEWEIHQLVYGAPS